MPTVATGEDEFVELDEAGNPRKKSARGRQRPQAAVRKKPAARRRIPPVKVPVVPGVPGVEVVADVAEDEDLDAEPVADVVASGGTSTGAPASAPRRPTGGGGRRGGKGAGGRAE